MILESPVFTIEAAVKAADFGVHRLELCADFAEGGETPSAGALKFLKERLNIPIFVMIRPRGGDFVYTPDELEVMKRDIQILSSFGADGFVFGVLDAEGNVNKAACKVLLEAADGLPCTFHRAFDICKYPKRALEDVISCGFERILTSGGENDVGKGLNSILELLRLAGNRIIIMPGGGLKPEHIPLLRKTGFLQEVHASCKSFRISESKYRHPHVKLSIDEEGFYKVLTIQKNQVDSFLEVLK